MAGYGYDTSTLRLSVKLPDGALLDVEGDSDGVNDGYTWSAHYTINGNTTTLPVEADELVLVDGVSPQDGDE
jgi:hypothetical protein